MNAASSSPERVRVHRLGEAEPRPWEYLDGGRRRIFDGAFTEQKKNDVPYYLRDENGKSDGKELTMSAKGYASHQRRSRSLSYDNDRGGIKTITIRNVSRESSQSDARGSFTDAADVIWSPSSPRDATVHLEIDTEDDIESHLEEFSRTVRLGHFKEAEQHFERHLVDHIDLEPVLLEYMDMLLECGSYTKDVPHKAPASGGDGPVPAKYYGTESGLYNPNNSNFGPGRSNTIAKGLGGMSTKLLPNSTTRMRLGVHIRSMYREFYSTGLIKKGFQTAEWDELLVYINAMKMDRQLCSSDLQILQYLVKVASCASNYCSSFCPPAMYFKIWSDRPDLYKSLLLDGRIWDVRDIISGCEPALVHHTWRTFIGADIYSSTFFADCLRDWNLEEYDESSYLAMLDILVTLGKSHISEFRRTSSHHNIECAKEVFEHARGFSTCIKDNNPEHIKSRPYLRWILAEAELGRHLAGLKNDAVSTQKSLRRFPGLTVWISALPIYIPISSENPGWCATTLQDNSTDLLETGLKAAQDLGDYRTEANFLRELACRSEDPKELLAELSNLQKSTQGDMVGYLQTCLTKYLLAHDEAQLQALRDELADFEDKLSSPPNFTGIIEDPLTEWCKWMIQCALFRSQVQFTVKLEEAQAAAVAASRGLPYYIKDGISNFSFYKRMVEGISRPLHQNRSRAESEENGDEAAKSAVTMAVAKYEYGKGRQKPEKEDGEKDSRFRPLQDLSMSGIGKEAATDLSKRVQNPDLQNPTKMSQKDVSLQALERDVSNSDSLIGGLKRAVKPRSRSGQRTAVSPLIVAASPIYSELLDLGHKESYPKQPDIQDKKDDGLQVKIDDGPQVEKIDEGPSAEEIGDRPPVETAEIVNPQTDGNRQGADDSGSTKNTGSNGHNEEKNSQQDHKMDPPQRRATFAYVESVEDEK
ncbi:hypothetical protein V494_03583 [Pseudogymnoascus sp. VKM F-4513 (FW-928)]|nr:hypothetical protein V494_03583 [Pseudogymnoascus sp. VKM F-4513 (FW-928)]